MVKIIAVNKAQKKKEEQAFDYNAYRNSFSNIDSFAKLMGLSLVILLMITPLVAGTDFFHSFGTKAAPEMKIISPGDGSIIPTNSTIFLAATTSDIKSTAKEEFYVNGIKLCTNKLPPYTCAWTLPSEKNRKYLIESRFYDKQGHIQSKTITVTSGNL